MLSRCTCLSLRTWQRDRLKPASTWRAAKLYQYMCVQHWQQIKFNIWIHVYHIYVISHLFWKDVIETVYIADDTFITSLQHCAGHFSFFLYPKVVIKTRGGCKIKLNAPLSAAGQKNVRAQGRERCPPSAVRTAALRLSLLTHKKRSVSCCLTVETPHNYYSFLIFLVFGGITINHWLIRYCS